MNTVQKSFSANCSIQLPEDLNVNLPDNKFVSQIKFVRQKVTSDQFHIQEYTVMSFKFESLTSEQKTILKNYLIKL